MNIFLDKTQFIKHHSLKYREDRIHDMTQIYNTLKNKLIPTDRARINEQRLAEYVKLYKKENREHIRKVLESVVFVSFKKFYSELKKQIDKFNNYLKTNSIKRYVFVLGVGDDAGASSLDFNIYKSNLWVFLLAWKYLKVKPYDIVLNLNTAIRLHYSANNIKDYLLLDDCSYSGDQMFNRVVNIGSTELLFHEKDSFLIKSNTYDTIYQPVQEKPINLHLVIPYLSKKAYDKIGEINLTSGFNIHSYNSYIINQFKDILDNTTLGGISGLYRKFYNYVYFGDLIPIFFEHKIADMLSTIDLILIKGQVLDDPEKRLIFIDSCIYDKNDPDKYDLNPTFSNFNQKKLYCPVPPYLKFKKILTKKLTEKKKNSDRVIR